MSYRGYSSFKLTPIWAIIGIDTFLLIITFVLPQLVFFLGLTPILLSREPWTIVTAMFIHSGLWHLLTNMLTFYFFGTFLSRLVGDKKFLMVYFIGGIVGNLFYIILTYLGIILSLRFLGDPRTLVIGASGAVFALGGALAVMRPNVKVYIIPIPVPISLWLAVVGGFFIISFFPFVAWQAHLGGLVFGLIAGKYLNKGASRYFF